MKKLFATLISALLIGFAVFGAGCSNSKWQEVQSITYQTSEGKNTITSTHEWEHGETVPAEKEEFDAHPNMQDYPSLNGEKIDVNKSNLIANPEKFYGRFFYYSTRDKNGEIVYKKRPVQSYTIHYVKVRFSSDDNIEINYYKDSSTGYTTIRVKPISYEITYFNS